MPTNPFIRPVIHQDLAHLKIIIDKTGLFPAEMLDEMISDFFTKEIAAGQWLTYDDGEPVAVAYYIAEPMTEGTWNILLMAVHPEHQSKGIGAALIKHIEQSLKTQNERILVVETSGLDEFERTRAFYKKVGYEEEGRIREFYQAGEDKVIFRKAL